MPSLRRALILGAVQGPAELLPVSSSAHARLLGADDKAYEVALHVGSALALIAERPRIDPRFAAITVAPPALAALLLQDLVEERLSGRRAIAAGLLAGSAALLAADAADGGRTAPGPAHAVAGAIGVAQACALWPGVSRSAATLAAGRLCGLSADEAAARSREALVPVLVAAAVRVAPRLRPSHLPAVAAAAASTAVALRVVPAPRRLWPFALYRTALAVGVVWKDRRP